MRASFVIAIVLACLAQPADARYLQRAIAQDHLPWSCETVLWAKAHFSEAELRSMGKAAGVSLTPHQRAEAKACFK